MFREEGMKIFTKGLAAKLLYCSFASTMFYVLINQIGRFYDTKISEDLFE